MEARLVSVEGSHNGAQTDGGRYAAVQSVQGQGGQEQSRGQACQQHGAPDQVGQRQSIQGQGGQGQGGQRQGVQGLHGAVGGVNCRRGRYSMSKIDGFRRAEVLPSPKLPSICHI